LLVTTCQDYLLQAPGDSYLS